MLLGIMTGAFVQKGSLNLPTIPVHSTTHSQTSKLHAMPQELPLYALASVNCETLSPYTVHVAWLSK